MMFGDRIGKDGTTCVKVVKEYDPALPELQCYPADLNQVWTNIIDNAIDAMAGTGELSLATRRDDPWVVVEIADTGPGIQPADQARIFDPFFTTKPPGQGIGMGLNIAHNIVVQAHGGRIDVASQPGQTRFEVRLPLAPPAAARN
jgi:signal transduction histidine kinase